MLPANLLDGGAVGVVKGAVQQIEAQPGAPGKSGRHPRGLAVQQVDPGAVVAGIGRQQDGQAVAQLLQVGRHQAVAALVAAGAPQGDQFGKIAVAIAVLRQQHQRQRHAAIVVHEVEMGAYDQRQGRLFGFGVRAHDAGQRAFIGDGQRAVAKLDGTRDQLLGVRGALQEGKIGQAEQLGIVGQALGCGSGEHD